MNYYIQEGTPVSAPVCGEWMCMHYWPTELHSL